MDQQMIDIEKVDLLNKSLDMKNSGYRLSQICAVKLEKLMFLYSFVKEGKLVTLRFYAELEDPVESLSWLYSYAFLYENELKDLFGVKMVNMRLDFQGHFYDTAVKTPFNPANSKENEVAKNG
ncbi:MAG: NADH-quinone oxidoreductase subunit C [Treponema sp.]|nr:NADH-quinone oxidoreductase subunit C [Treponema sp.]